MKKRFTIEQSQRATLQSALSAASLALLLAGGGAPVFAAAPVVSVSVSPSTNVSVGATFTVTLAIAGYSSTNEVDGCNFRVTYPTSLFSLVGGSLASNDDASFGTNQNWLRLPAQDGVSNAPLPLTDSTIAGGGVVDVSVADLRLASTRGTTNGSGFLYSFILTATNAGIGVITAAAGAGNTALFDVNLATAGLPSPTFSNATVLVIVSNTAPALSATSNRTLNPGVTLTLTNAATDPDAPPQLLTFALLAAPSNAALHATSGVFTWRAPVARAGTTNPVAVVVADNGTPGLSATQQFSIFVNPLTGASVTTVSLTNTNQLRLLITGGLGPDYTVQASTNLSNWSVLLTTNSPAPPLSFTDTNAGSFLKRFYRVLLGP